MIRPTKPLILRLGERWGMCAILDSAGFWSSFVLLVLVFVLSIAAYIFFLVDCQSRIRIVCCVLRRRFGFEQCILPRLKLRRLCLFRRLYSMSFLRRLCMF